MKKQLNNQNQEQQENKKDKKKKNILPILLFALGGAGLAAGITFLSISLSKNIQNANTVNVSFDIGDATITDGSKDIKISKNTKFGLINKPTLAKEGYIFEGWYYDSTFENKVVDTDIVSTNSKFYVKFVSDGYSYLDFKGDDYGAKLVGNTKVAILPTVKFSTINKPTATWDDRKFKCWQNGGVDVTDDTTFEKGTILRPSSEAIAPSEALIVFKAKDGEEVQFSGLTRFTLEADKTKFSECTKPTATLAGKQFNSWQYKDEDGNYHDFDGSYVFPMGTTVVYANFEEVDIEQKIYLEYEGTKYWLTNETDAATNLIFMSKDGTTIRQSRASFNWPITIGSKKKSIDMNFLANCQNFNNGGSTLTIPANVETIGDCFLHNCLRFNQVIDISACTNLKKIGLSFLQKCTSFNSEIKFPSTLTDDFEIGAFFMFECYVYNQPLTIPNVKKIAASFMEGCIAFNQPLTIPSTVTKIESFFMSRCNRFNQPLTLGNNITSIENDFMYQCYYFNSILTLPNQITTIPDCFMEECVRFNQQLTIPSTVTKIGNYFLSNCSTFNNDIALPNGIKTIGACFMNKCESYSYEMIVPDSISDENAIGQGFMYICSNITSIVINCPASCFQESDYTLSCVDKSDPSYATGITVTGDDAANFKSRFPNSSDSPYRNLI